MTYAATMNQKEEISGKVSGKVPCNWCYRHCALVQRLPQSAKVPVDCETFL